MKKTFLSLTFIVSLLLCSKGIQAQDAAKDLDQLKLAQKYWVGTWQQIRNDTIFVWEMKQDGNVISETDYIVVNGVKSADSYWSYSFNPEINNFYMFAAFVNAGCMTGIGSFTAENKWRQEGFELFNRDKYLGKAEFVFDTPTSLTATAFNPDGAKLWEIKATKIK
jgi:hypothetical protein